MKRKSSLNSKIELETYIKSLNNRESYISITIGFSAVLILGILAYKYIPRNQIKIKQQADNQPTVEKPIPKEETYTVSQGERLWDIAVKFYNDGYAWTKISQANNLSNPNTIHSGNILIIPK